MRPIELVSLDRKWRRRRGLRHRRSLDDGAAGLLLRKPRHRVLGALDGQMHGLFLGARMSDAHRRRFDAALCLGGSERGIRLLAAVADHDIDVDADRRGGMLLWR